MGVPEIEGLKVIGLIGPGGCGSVCSAEDGPGNPVALKIFENSAINGQLLERMARRLSTGGWPDGVMPVIFSDFLGLPAIVVMPLHADLDAAGELVPRSLQHRLEEFSSARSWSLVRAVADAIAAMHAKRVAHGNLKPGNVFFDENGRVLLSDWTLGNMPGTRRFEFTDAVLYQPPEQLREPRGYDEEAGYRWDVFAFGVLSFRLLTGKFPRCEEAFAKVAPAPGETRREGIRADVLKIANYLESSDEIVWPELPPDRLEAGLREWITACLSLDPARRPATMAEVVAGFAALDLQINSEAERESLIDQRGQADRRAWWGFSVAGAATVTAVILGASWQVKATQRAEKMGKRSDSQITALKAVFESAEREKILAEKNAAEAKQALVYERDLARARLEGARLIGDHLFGWAMEKGHRGLPPLDGREQRLKSLERYFEEFLSRASEADSLEIERARVRVQLAEISLAAGNPDLAIRRLSDALDAWKSLPMDAELRFRLATNRLLLALLLQSGNDPRMAAAFDEARKELGEVPPTEVDAGRLQQLLAILDFHEAKLLSAQGDEARALQQLMAATQTLNRLADERPDSVVLRSELAACYLSSATILEGMGNLGDAREVQALAAAEILKQLKANPKDAGLRFDLAGCYGGMAEAAVLSGDMVNVDSMSAEAVKLLEGIVREQPDHAEAISRLASQIGLRAGLMRDRGEADAALKSFDEGIRMLEGVKASSPGNPLVGYRLALLWWQKGRMLGMAGNRTAEIDLIRRAQSSLTQLEAEKTPGGPSAEKIQASSAYLLGDLGHALQLAGKPTEAKQAFAESVAFWDRLLKSRPQSEEYQESLAWCRQRIKDLK